MSQLVEFDIGCRRCVHLQKMDKDTFTCKILNSYDGSSLYPIQDGKHTEDWGACDNEYRETSRTLRGAVNE